jgi:hypothetical protein
MLYFVIIEGPYSTKEPVDWIYESPVSELTREEVKRNIQECRFSPVKQIIEVDLAKGTSSDVTAEIAQEIASTYDTDDPLPEDLANFFLRNNAQTW